MANYLFVDPVTGMTQSVEHNSILTFVQQDVNLNEVGSDAPAQGGRPAGGMGLMWLLLLMMLMFILMRPRKDKEGDKFRNSLQLDQEVVTSSGTFGKIKFIDEVSVILEISKDLRIRVDKRYINPVPTVQPAAPEKKSRKSKKDEQESGSKAEK